MPQVRREGLIEFTLGERSLLSLIGGIAIAR
jgi:hypothetical protein